MNYEEFLGKQIVITWKATLEEQECYNTDTMSAEGILEGVREENNKMWLCLDWGLLVKVLPSTVVVESK